MKRKEIIKEKPTGQTAVGTIVKQIICWRGVSLSSGNIAGILHMRPFCREGIGSFRPSYDMAINENLVKNRM